MRGLVREMQLDVVYEFLPKKRTTRTSQVMDHFGIEFETGRHIIAEKLDLPLEVGQIVCFTGDSGSGKSSLMRTLSGQLDGVLDVDELGWPQQSLVDCLPIPFEQGVELLAGCGLGEAQLLLRTPQELSDGQRYRFRLASGIAQQPKWLVADEFTATLDRNLAKVLAFNLRKLCDRLKIGFLLATTHEDILEDLQPDLHVSCRLGRTPLIVSRKQQADLQDGKKKESALKTSYGLAKGPKPTGRTSLGGIIAAGT